MRARTACPPAGGQTPEGERGEQDSVAVTLPSCPIWAPPKASVLQSVLREPSMTDFGVCVLEEEEPALDLWALPCMRDRSVGLAQNPWVGSGCITLAG